MAIKGLAELGELLDEYSREVRKTEEKSRRKTARAAVEKLKNTSPKRAGGGDYARSWATKTERGRTIIHNTKHYQLTHLLEKGHRTVNKYGEYERTPAHVHIKPVEDWARGEYVEEVERNLKNVNI